MNDLIKTLDYQKIAKFDSEDAGLYMALVCSIKFRDWFNFVEKNLELLPEISSDNIPQYSYLDRFNVVTIIRRKGNTGYTYEQVGRYLRVNGLKKNAYVKYGENQSKLARDLSLLCFHKQGRTVYITLSELGKKFDALDDNSKESFILKQSLLIPVISKFIFTKEDLNTVDELNRFLPSRKTCNRRDLNVCGLIRQIGKKYGQEIDLNEYPTFRKVTYES